MKNRIKNVLFNAGLSSEEFSSIIPRLLKENYKFIQGYLVVMILAFSVLTIMASITNTFASKNIFIYFLCMIMALLMYLFHKDSFSEESMCRMRAGSYSLMIIIYVFSLYITMIHYDKPAVTTIIFLVILPLLFTDRPIFILLITTIADIGFCIITYMVKDASISQIDIWNGISFGFLGMVAGVIIMQVKIRNMYQTEQIIYLSQTDILTETKNRNHYEKYVDDLKKEKDSGIFCIYVDVNALHECNNLKGHKAGDEMLQFVSRHMMKSFGRDYTFRIGGDEFVSFTRGWTEEEMEIQMKWLENACLEVGYSISAGYSSTSICETVDEMILDAEQKMYQEKRRYYSEGKGTQRSSSWTNS